MAKLLQNFFLQKCVRSFRRVLLSYRKHRFDHLSFGDFGNFRLNLFYLFFPDHSYGGFHKLSYHGFDVAADVAHFGELGGFHLDERRFDDFRKPSCNFRLADAGRAFHNDVFRGYLFPEFFGKLASSVTISESYGNRLFGRRLTDDVSVQFLNRLFRCQIHNLPPISFQPSGCDL